METQTEIRIPYELLTPAQKKEICNGCGGKGSWLKPPLKAFFKTSCNHHDYGYWCGCTEAERRECDVSLVKYMVADCLTLEWWKILIYYPWSLAYYFMVRKFGVEFFYWGQNKRWPVPTKDQKDRLVALGIVKGHTHKLYRY